jgi:hypothetical protein
LVNPNTRREIINDRGIVTLMGIDKYENIKYIARPEIRAPGSTTILRRNFEEVKITPHPNLA